MSLIDKQKQTAIDFIDGYNKFDAEGVLARRSKDCVHKIRPASLQQPELNNNEYIARYIPFFPLLRNYKLTILKVLNDAEAHTVVLHATGTADTPAGPYRNEYVFFLKTDESGEQLVEVEEFVDSGFLGEWMPKIMACEAVPAVKLSKLMKELHHV